MSIWGRTAVVGAFEHPTRFAPDKTATRVFDQNGPHHYREHTAQIRDWRRRTGL